MLSYFLLGGSVRFICICFKSSIYVRFWQYMDKTGSIWYTSFSSNEFSLDDDRYTFISFCGNLMIDVNWVYYFMIFGISGMLLGLHKKPS